ncbi:MAG TPA: flagellar biosynthetic protein FliR [Stellaceae bacterium]|jgi:flagellar biosynthesis protein FliR|nr:flagellar biosynthetic protein FliR [Stellaceae bacterium]
MLQQLLPENVFALMLIFARIGTALMLLPGFGEVYVMQRFRLLLGFLVSLLLTPILAPLLPPLPGSAVKLADIVGSEVVIGLFLGTVSRILLAALDTAGTVASFQLGLSAAQIFNPMAASQGSLPGTLYSVLGVLLIFLTDLHHMLLRALVDSYDVFAPGVLPPLNDLSDMIARSVAGAFVIGIEMAAPFILLGLVFFIALGIVGRLVPQLQIMFVTLPLQILGGLFALVFVLAAGMQWFLDAFQREFTALTGG